MELERSQFHFSQPNIAGGARWHHQRRNLALVEGLQSKLIKTNYDDPQHDQSVSRVVRLELLASKTLLMPQRVRFEKSTIRRVLISG